MATSFQGVKEKEAHCLRQRPVWNKSALLPALLTLPVSSLQCRLSFAVWSALTNKDGNLANLTRWKGVFSLLEEDKERKKFSNSRSRHFSFLKVCVYMYTQHTYMYILLAVSA